MSETDPKQSLVKLVELLRKNHSRETGQRLTNQEISNSINVHPASLSRALHGNLKPYTIDLYFNKIQKAYNVQLKEEAGQFLLAGGGSYSPNEERNKKSEHSYIYYYLPRQSGKTFTITKAVLRINEQRKTATLTFQSRERPSSPVVKQARVMEAQGHLILIFEDKKMGPSSQLPAMNYFSGGWSSLTNKILIGTYVAAGPSCGMAVAEKCREEEVEGRLQDEEIQPIITALLREARIEPQHNLKTAVDFSELKAASLVEKVSNYEGVYSAYILESRSSREEIHELVLEIYDGCRFRFKSKHSGEHLGYIVDYYNRTIVCYFGYRQSKGYFRNSMIINLDPNRARNAISPELMSLLPEQSFIGIYSGVEGDNYPIGGRILLIRSDKVYDIAVPTAIRLAEFTKRDHFLKKRPYLIPFFRGELDKYIDSPALLEKYRLFNLSEGRQYSDILERFPFEGIYFIYRLSTDGKWIYKKPMRIHETGKVTVIEKDKEGRGFNFKGDARYWKDSYLSINLYERERKPFFIYHVFFVGGSLPQTEKYYLGISSSFTSTNKLRASREVLIKTDLENLSEVYYDKIPVRGQFGLDERAEALERQVPGIIVYMTGNTENQIVMPREISPRLERQEDFGLHFFASACFQHQEGKPIEEVIRLVKKAILHGFRDKERLNQAIHGEGGQLNHPMIQQAIDLSTL